MKASEFAPKMRALITMLRTEKGSNAKYEDVAEGYSEDVFEVDGEEWLVLTEDEADDAWDENLDNYLEECVLPEIPDSLRFYFDEDAWKRDARMDGRGHCLSTYDGCEYELNYQDNYYYFYRLN